MEHPHYHIEKKLSIGGFKITILHEAQAVAISGASYNTHQYVNKGETFYTIGDERPKVYLTYYGPGHYREGSDR